MLFNEYQEKAMEFRLDTANHVYALTGLVGEIGELYGYLAKAIRDNGAISDEYIEKELGDILWFVAAIADDYSMCLDDLATKNIAKLTKRKQAGTIKGSGDDR